MRKSDRPTLSLARITLRLLIRRDLKAAVGRRNGEDPSGTDIGCPVSGAFAACTSGTAGD